MNVIKDYQSRIRQASTLEEKKALAAELHHMADSFDDEQKAEYEESMHTLRQDIARQLEAIEAAIQRAEAILGRHATTTGS